MPKRSERTEEPLNPKAREAGLRILERALGKHGASGEPLGAIRKYLDEAVLAERPDLKGKPEKILNVERVLSWKLLEFITGSQKKLSAKKENQIIEKFVTNSVSKYLDQKKI